MTDEIPASAPQGFRTVNIAGRSALAQDESGRVFGDFYYRAMKVSWPKFFASTAVVFLTLNSCFALAYVMGDNPIANTRPHSFVDLFFFSVETLATVGFGDMHPQTTYAHVVATIEIFTGMSFLAVMTGLIFARFSRPRARLVFARNPVVNRHEGQPTLMIRVANARANMISDAAAQLWVVRTERSAEGATFRRFHRLALHRQENPMFILSWTLLHALEASSPLFGQSAEDLAASEATLDIVVLPDVGLKKLGRGHPLWSDLSQLGPMVRHFSSERHCGGRGVGSSADGQPPDAPGAWGLGMALLLRYRP